MSVLRLTRSFPAPAERVFDAWTNPRVVRTWWAAQHGWATSTADIDLRPQGRYRLSMRDPVANAEYTVFGEYLEVTPPERLVYTWTWEGEPAVMRGSEGSLVTVEFAPAGAATEVTITHERFADDHIAGPPGRLDGLPRQPRADLLTTAVDVRTETEIARPRAEVAAYAAFVARFLGRRLAYTYAITDYVPGERLVMRTAEGPFPMETTYTWADTPAGGTRMTLRNRGEPAGFSNAPLMAGAIRRANRKDLRRLRELLERQD